MLQTLLIICISPALVVVAWAEPSPTPNHITSRIPRQSVQSTAIAKVGYSKRRHILEIEFVNGAVYRYFDIPLSVYHDLMSAESKARFYDSNSRKHNRSVLVRQRQKQESPEKSPAPRRAYGAGCHSRGDQFRAESGKHRTSFNISATNNDNGHELAVLPRTAAMKRVFQKLDLRINNQFRVERTDMLLPNGDRIVTTYSNQTRAPIPPSTFEFKPPPGTEVTTPLG